MTKEISDKCFFLKTESFFQFMLIIQVDKQGRKQYREQEYSFVKGLVIIPDIAENTPHFKRENRFF